MVSGQMWVTTLVQLLPSLGCLLHGFGRDEGTISCDWYSHLNVICSIIIFIDSAIAICGMVVA
jgi:hypothetical protein